MIVSIFYKNDILVDFSATDRNLLCFDFGKIKLCATSSSTNLGYRVPKALPEIYFPFVNKNRYQWMRNIDVKMIKTMFF